MTRVLLIAAAILGTIAVLYLLFVGILFVGLSRLKVDEEKESRWPDSMCNHCEYGDLFPECPNPDAGEFEREPGPLYCAWFQESRFSRAARRTGAST